MVFKQNFSLSKPTASWKRVAEQLKKRQGWKEKELWKKHISRKRLNLKTIAQPATYLENFDSCVRQQKKNQLENFPKRKAVFYEFVKPILFFISKLSVRFL